MRNLYPTREHDDFQIIDSCVKLPDGTMQCMSGPGGYTKRGWQEFGSDLILKLDDAVSGSRFGHADSAEQRDFNRLSNNLTDSRPDSFDCIVYYYIAEEQVMTLPKIEFSEHAKSRIKDRRITRSQVRSCLLKGKSVGLDVGGRVVKEIKVGNKKLHVIFIHVKTSILVITSYWKR